MSCSEDWNKAYLQGRFEGCFKNDPHGRLRALAEEFLLEEGKLHYLTEGWLEGNLFSLMRSSMCYLSEKVKRLEKDE